jgi:hypothetical protein
MKSNKRYPKGRARRKRPEPPLTVRQMTDEEWTRAQERTARRKAGIEKWAAKETPYDASKRSVLSGDDPYPRSQKPSYYRRKRRPK